MHKQIEGRSFNQAAYGVRRFCVSLGIGHLFDYRVRNLCKNTVDGGSGSTIDHQYLGVLVILVC